MSLAGERPGEPSRNTPRSTGRRCIRAFARGFRLSTELVAGVLVGAAIGWALDRWLGISPWGLIVFLLLGFAAGVVNVMRAAGVTPEQIGAASGSGRRYDVTAAPAASR